MRIKIKYVDKSLQTLKVFKKGDWIDLYTRDDVSLTAPQAGTRYQKNNSKFRDVKFDSCLLNLNVCLSLPAGFEAVIVPRSSTFKNYGLLQTNHFGVVDNTFCGDSDEWKMSVIATRAINITAGTRVAQFRIQLSQKATIWQKIRWIFWNGKIKFIVVDHLEHSDRGSSMTNNTTNK